MGMQAAASVENPVQQLCVAFASHTLCTASVLAQPLSSVTRSGSSAGHSGASAHQSVAAMRATVRSTLLTGGHVSPTCGSLLTLMQLLLGLCDAGALFGLPDTLQPHLVTLPKLMVRGDLTAQSWPIGLLRDLLQGLLTALPLASRDAVLAASQFTTAGASTEAQAPRSERCTLAQVCLQELCGAVAAIVPPEHALCYLDAQAHLPGPRPAGRSLWEALATVLHQLGASKPASCWSPARNCKWGCACCVPVAVLFPSRIFSPGVMMHQTSSALCSCTRLQRQAQRRTGRRQRHRTAATRCRGASFPQQRLWTHRCPLGHAAVSAGAAGARQRNACWSAAAA